MKLKKLARLVLVLFLCACGESRSIADEKDVNAFFNSLETDPHAVVGNARRLYERTDGASRSKFLAEVSRLLRKRSDVNDVYQKSENETDKQIIQKVREQGKDLEDEW